MFSVMNVMLFRRLIIGGEGPLGRKVNLEKPEEVFQGG